MITVPLFPKTQVQFTRLVDDVAQELATFDLIETVRRAGLIQEQSGANIEQWGPGFREWVQQRHGVEITDSEAWQIVEAVNVGLLELKKNWLTELPSRFGCVSVPPLSS